MRRLIAFLLALTLMISALPAMAQDGGEDEHEAATIAEILEESAHNEASPEFTLLLEAVEEAGLMIFLEENGPFTVFAPTDAAFTASLASLDLEFEALAHDYELLLSVVMYHIVLGDYAAADLAALGEARLATAYPGSSVEMVADGATVSVNGVRVIGTDVEASNGVIHIIDGVLLPEEGAGSFETLLREVAEEDLVAVIEAATEGNSPQERQFEILLQAVIAADLIEALAEVGPFTIFAPTDEAFNDFLTANNFTLSDLLTDPDGLAAVLAYHVVPYPLAASDLINLDGAILPTLGGGSLRVSLEAGAVLINGVSVNGDLVDLATHNGIIHGLDGVLAPPAE